jgi:hypothetical protein
LRRLTEMASIRRFSTVGVIGLALVVVLAACGGDDPTAAPPAAATATPTAMAMEATATPTPLPPGATAPPATAAPTAAPTAASTAAQPTPTPLVVDPGFDAEAYFSGKTIRIMVGFNPGGGTDAQARFMSRAWNEYIPGNPRIVVTNRTPVLTERNFVWRSDPDGLTLGLEANSGIYEMVENGAEFDLREVTVIGVTSGSEGLWIRRHDLTPNYDCFDSAWGSPGPELTVASIMPNVESLGSYTVLGWLADEFNVPLRMFNIATANGSAPQYLMIEQGVVNSWSSATLWDQFPRTRPEWISSGYLRPFADLSVPGFDLGHNGLADFHCPNVADTHLNEEQVVIYRALREPQIFMAKNIIGPPGIPNEVTAVLRQALADALGNPEFVVSLERATGIKTNFVDGATAQAQIIAATNTYFDNKALTDEIAQGVFDKYVQ